MEIAKLVPCPDRGQKTVTLLDGTKLTIEKGFNYKADFDALEKIGTAFTPAPIKTKTTKELDEKGYEWYKANNPEMFALLAQHVTVTPKKVSISVKVKE
jgi:hypothetical protein